MFDHEQALPHTFNALSAVHVPCILVDDGSGDECRRVIDGVVAANSWVDLVRRQRNGGKGAAIKDGLRRARQAGFSHALQIDADGQHDVDDIERFLEQARLHPDWTIAGAARFDDSVPRVRRYARQLTRVWVWINTLSFDIDDAMCGLRVYPLAEIIPILDETRADRMDFDIEILVRLHWQGRVVVSLPTDVTYPIDGVSHFRLGPDNVLISLAHARLFLGMLVRLPARAWRSLQS